MNETHDFNCPAFSFDATNCRCGFSRTKEIGTLKIDKYIQPESGFEHLQEPKGTGMSEWECPRCRRINHILKLTCDCPPSVQSSSTICP